VKHNYLSTKKIALGITHKCLDSRQCGEGHYRF